jgi:pimeloyl-ACP methyl ester carboxylesterase
MRPKLNYKIIGKGKPIIILHGLFGMLDNWLNMAKKLDEAGYMVILVDQRDHGRSEHSSDFSYPLLSEDLFHFMEDNWIHEAILIGHSMGGKTGLQFISEHESMVTKFIVIDIGIKKYEGGHQEVFDALFSIDIESVQSRNEVENAMMSRLHDYGTVQFLMKNLTRKKDGGFEWKMNLTLLFANYEKILDGITFTHPCFTETCFIKGSDSNYILDEDMGEILKSLPKARLITIPDAGHWVHADKPNELFNEIIDFIRH